MGGIVLLLATGSSVKMGTSDIGTSPSLATTGLHLASMAGRRAARWHRRRFETPFDNQYGSRRRINLTPIAHMDRISQWTICSIVDSNFPDKMPSFYLRSSNRPQRVH